MEWERVVTKNVLPNAVVVNNPARVLRIVNKEEAKEYRPTVVFVNEDNSISRITSYEKHGEIG